MRAPRPLSPHFPFLSAVTTLPARAAPGADAAAARPLARPPAQQPLPSWPRCSEPGGRRGLARPSRTPTRQWGSGCCQPSGDLDLRGVPWGPGRCAYLQRAGRCSPREGEEPSGKGGWGRKNRAFQAPLSWARPVPAAPRPPRPQPPAPTGLRARHPALPELGPPGPQLHRAGRRPKDLIPREQGMRGGPPQKGLGWVPGPCDPSRSLILSLPSLQPCHPGLCPRSRLFSRDHGAAALASGLPSLPGARFSLLLPSL